MFLPSAALCSSTAFLSHQSEFTARVRFCSSLQASLYAAVVDLVLLVCNTLWWAWSLLLLSCVEFFPSPTIGQEHRPSFVQNSPYEWWYLVLQCWAWSAYLSIACCAFLVFILKATFDLSIWWSVQQFAPRIARVLGCPSYPDTSW